MTIPDPTNDLTVAASPAAGARPLPAADRVAWACLAAGAAGLAAGLVRYWGANPGYADRLLVLAAAAWAARYLPATRGRPRPIVGLPLVVMGALLVPLAWYLQIRAGERTLLLWWQATGLLTATAGLILSQHGWSRLRAAAFPLLFPLFALPIPDTVLVPLQGRLQELTATLAAAALPRLGVPVERSGFVLRLADGDLGVAEACSGVRSLTALTAIAAFISHLRGFGPGRGIALVLLAVPVVAGVNALRVVLTGLIQEAVGRDYVQGSWHEGLGLLAVLAGTAGVLSTARLFGRSPQASVDRGANARQPLLPAQPRQTPRPAGWVTSAVLVAGVVASVAAAYAGLATEVQVLTAVPIDEVPLALGDWRGEVLEVPDAVAEMLVPDRVVYRVYQNNIGRQAHCYVIYWAAAGVIKGYHHPEICWPNRGFVPGGRRREPVRVPGCGPVLAEAQEFVRGPDRQVVVSWTQEGRRVWDDEDERRAAGRVVGGSGGGHGWVLDLLAAAGPAEGARLTVLVATPSGGPSARADALELAGLVAAEVYRLCPWAAPE